MKIKTLYVSDLDGTLLSPESCISEQSSSIISELSRHGAMITVATARTPATVVPLLNGTITNPPAVVMTGTAMWDRAEARLFNTHFIPAHDVGTILSVCAQCGVSPYVYLLAPDDTTLDVYHSAPTLNSAEKSFYEERCRLRLKRFHLNTPVPAISATRTMLCYAMGTRDSIVAAAQSLRKSVGCTVCCYPDIFNPLVFNLELFPPGVDKASAVSRLKEHTGADRLVVFGDSMNDLPMLAIADVAVAVGNALPQVKRAADIVIEPNYTDSVARFIESDFYG